MNSPPEVDSLVAKQRAYFATGATLSLEARRSALEGLRQSVKRHEEEILGALREDLGKCAFEGYSSEIYTLLEEIRHAKKNLRRWIKPQKVPTPLVALPGKSRIRRDPFGVALILAPWNYPLYLAFTPLVGALAAGNCGIIKPSEYAPASAAVIEKVITAAFDPAHVQVVQGDAGVATALVEAPVDIIFFTGGTEIGRKVYQSAAKDLKPVVLELGGKSPCFVDATVDSEIAGRRIAWGRYLNAGQTCVAPDYVCVTAEAAPALEAALGRAVSDFFGSAPLEHPDYGSIVNRRHFDRLSGLLEEALAEEGTHLLFGGDRDPEKRRIAPTALRGTEASVLMQGEIFGPILHLMVVESLDEAFEIVGRHPDPLAAYLFSTDPAARRRFEGLRYGGASINDTVFHLSSTRLPFGGVGSSGLGAYHGRHSFNTFSRPKSLLHRRMKPDIPLRYPPYGGRLRLFRRFFPG